MQNNTGNVNTQCRLSHDELETLSTASIDYDVQLIYLYLTCN